MIIDDDAKIRSRIKTMIDWDSLPVEFACEAADSDTARDLYLLYRPKIIITDIFIPIITGLDLAEELAKIDPEIRFIIITGYDDFEYAKRAVKLGAVDLLSKPLFPETINESLRKAVGYFEALQKEKASMESLQELLKNNLHDIQASYVGNLLHNRPKQPELIRSKLRSLHLQISGPRYAVMLAAAESDEDFEAISVLLKDTVSSVLNQQGYEAFSYLDSQFRVSCVVNIAAEDPEDDLEAAMNLVCDEMKLTAGCGIRAGLGRITEGLAELYLSYNEALLALNYCVTAPGDSVILYKNINLLMEPFASRGEILGLIQEKIRDENSETLGTKVETAVYGFIQSLYFKNRDPESVTAQTRSFLLEILLMVSSEAYRLGYELENIVPYETVRSRLFLSSSQSDQIDFISDMIRKLFLLREHKTAENTNYLISMAKTYIAGELGNEKLDLETVSNHVGLSKIYFCKLFHKEEGISFTNYLKRERILRAKDLLLHTSMKIYEISYAVGFTNPKYFGYVFKQETGLTPGDFQRLQA